MASQTVLILGAGANIGAKVAQQFLSKGFKVAIASRTLDPELVKAVNFSVKADFSEPSSIKDVFASVESQVGVPTYGLTVPTDGVSSVPLASFENDLKVNTVSAYAAVQEAVAGFKTLPPSTLKTFIYTGNILNLQVIPSLVTLGVGKAASAHLIHAASVTHKADNYRFYYADERKADGSVAGNDISGEAAASFYYDLSEAEDSGPWDATFVAGKGYTVF